MRVSVVLLVALAVGCAPERNPSSATEDADLATCRVVRQGSSLPAELAETSGVAFGSARGTVWTLNDAGNDPVLFVADSANLAFRVVRVAGAKNEDWEDLALGPCPAGRCIYIGAIGDNNASRTDAAIVRVPEPGPGVQETAPAERFPVRYPGGPRDAEALFVLPSGEIFVITRGRNSPIALFRYPLPLRTGQTAVLEQVRQITPGPMPRNNQVTGADATADGRWVAVRTYSQLFLYRTRDLLAGHDSAAVRVDLSPLGEPQGEGVALRDDGAVLLTSEAWQKGALAPAARLQCNLP